MHGLSPVRTLPPSHLAKLLKVFPQVNLTAVRAQTPHKYPLHLSEREAEDFEDRTDFRVTRTGGYESVQLI